MTTKGVVASSMVMAGCILTAFGGITASWAGTFIALGGFIFYLIGLVNFKKEMDDKGKSAVGLIFIGTCIGAGGALIGLIPFARIVFLIVLLAALILQLIGYLQLKSSEKLGKDGAEGSNLMVIAMGIMLGGTILSFIPGVGRTIATILFLGALAIMFYGWLGIQKGYIGETTLNIQSVTYILIGMVVQMGATSVSGWGSALAAAFGFVLFFLGLNNLKDTLDEAGKAAVQLLIIAVLIGVVASILEFISAFVGRPSYSFEDMYRLLSGQTPQPSVLERIVSVAFMAAFVVKLIGFIKFKDSEILGTKAGKTGSTLLIIAMGLGIVASLFSGLLVIGGGFMKGFFGIAGMVLVLLGWINIQKGMVEKA